MRLRNIPKRQGVMERRRIEQGEAKHGWNLNWILVSSYRELWRVKCTTHVFPPWIKLWVGEGWGWVCFYTFSLSLAMDCPCQGSRTSSEMQLPLVQEKLSGEGGSCEPWGANFHNKWIHWLSKGDLDWGPTVSTTVHPFTLLSVTSHIKFTPWRQQLLHILAGHTSRET